MKLNSISAILRTASLERRGDVLLNHGVPVVHISDPGDQNAALILDALASFAVLYRASHDFYETTDGIACGDQEIERFRISLGDALDAVELITRTTGEIYGNDHANTPSAN